MPIFMDRHYSENATRTAIAMAHEQDLKIESEYGVKFLTYWFDENRHTTFCLVDAPDMEAIKLVHKKAHGDIPHEIIEVDPNTVQLFLGRIADPIVEGVVAATDQIESAFRVIMFTDLVGSTAMTSRLGSDKAMHLLRIHNALIRNAIREFNGNEVKHTGDGFMVSFTRAEDCIDCAFNIQKAFEQQNKQSNDEPLYVKIGISAGEPLEEDNDLFGTPVQLAARICDFSSAQEVCLDENAFASLSEQKNFTISETNQCSFKGIDKGTTVLKLDWRN